MTTTADAAGLAACGVDLTVEPPNKLLALPLDTPNKLLALPLDPPNKLLALPLDPPNILLVPPPDPNRLEPNAAVVAIEADVVAREAAVLEPPSALALPAKAENALETNVPPPADDAPNAPVEGVERAAGETASAGADAPLLVLVSQLE